MIHIVPAAGLDFTSVYENTKFEQLIGQDQLIELTLLSRPWKRSNDIYVFVFLDLPETRKYFEILKTKISNCEAVFLSCETSGAASSVLSAMGLVLDNEKICIDLADIIINSEIQRKTILNELEDNVSAVLAFDSSDPCYSYFSKYFDGRFKAREKKVISSYASAGVYFFKNRNILLKAFGNNIGNSKLMVNNLNYIAPMFDQIQSCSIISSTITEYKK